MWIILFSFLSVTVFAQELELNTKNIHVYAQIKNCIDFTMCSAYEETLNKTDGTYRWRVKFSEPIEKVRKAMADCRINYSDYSLLLRSEHGKVLSDFKLMYGTKNERLQQKYFPMELRSEALISLKKKESSVETLLRSSEPLPAMKSTVFEFEYPLQEYELKVGTLPQKVLGRTHHLQKDVTYDLNKWDGRVCRFYQVMRHEVQHVKNVREIIGCSGGHHFARGKNDDISVYVNDLSFISRYCPEDKALYQNVESVLFAMYEGRPVETGCDQAAAPHEPKKAARKNERSSASAHDHAGKKAYLKALLRGDPDAWKYKPTGNEPLPQKNPALR